MRFSSDTDGVGTGYPEVNSDQQGSSTPRSAYGEWGCRAPASKGSDLENTCVTAPSVRVRRGASLRQRSAALRPAWGARMPTGKTGTAVACTSNLRESLREGLNCRDPSAYDCHEPTIEPPTKESWCPAFLCNPPYAQDLKLPDAIVSTLAVFSERVQMRSSVLLGWDHPQLRAFFSQQMKGLGIALGSAFLAYQAFATWRSTARQGALVSRFRDVTAQGRAECDRLQNLLDRRVAAHQSLLSQAQHLETQRNACLAAAAKLVAGPQANVVLKRCMTEWQMLVMSTSCRSVILQYSYRKADTLTREHQGTILRQCLFIWRREALQKSTSRCLRIRFEWLVERTQLDRRESLCHQCYLAWRNVVLQLRLSVALGQAQHGVALAAGAAKVQQKFASLLFRSSETSGTALLHQCVHGWMQVAKDKKLRYALDKSRLAETELEERQKIAGHRLLAMFHRSLVASGTALVDQCFRGWFQSMKLEVQVVEAERARNLSMQKSSAMLQLCLRHFANSKGPDLLVIVKSWRSLCKDKQLQKYIDFNARNVQRSARQAHEHHIERLDWILSISGDCQLRLERRRCFMAWRKELASKNVGQAPSASRLIVDSDWSVVPPPPPGALSVPREDWGLGNPISSIVPAWPPPSPHAHPIKTTSPRLLSGVQHRPGPIEDFSHGNWQALQLPQHIQNEQLELHGHNFVDKPPTANFLVDEQQWRRAVQERKEKEAARRELERSPARRELERSHRQPGALQCNVGLQYNAGRDSVPSSVALRGPEIGAQVNTLTPPSVLGDSDYLHLASSAMVSEESYRELLEYNRRELQSRRGKALRA